MEAVIFIGLQASGKSTFYHRRFQDTHLRINLDMLKTRYRENILLRACLEMKQPFVVDNTNPTPRDRARYIVRAKEARFRVVGYYFRSSLAEALQRNDRRNGEYAVPAVGLRGTHKRLVLPSREEGFDQLFSVRIADGGTFDVQEGQVEA